jgi:hypothetical protein
MSGWTIMNNTIRDAECGMLIGTSRPERFIFLDPNSAVISWTRKVVSALSLLLGGGRRNEIKQNHFDHTDLPIHFDNRWGSRLHAKWD